jgi:cytochrome oxidase Cu insertion factor (SCO1/SenC/PrrC family)
MFRRVCLMILVALALVAVVPSKGALAFQGRGASSRKKVARYSCPMHPDIVRSKPGVCPKCNMALRPVKDEGVRRGGPPAPPPGVGADTEEIARLRIPDAAVLDQNGDRLSFYTDLVKGRTVAINFIFTTCTTICPPMTATFRRVQQQLGERVGRDVRLISVSVDPATDTPERLKEFASKFKAEAGWSFVTGDKPEIDKLLAALGAPVADKNDHSPTILIVNDATGKATRTYGLAPPFRLAQLIADSADGK